MTVADPVRLLLMANFADRLGGGEESLLTLARGLDRRRYAPHAVVPGEGEIAEALRRLAIPVAALPLPSLRPWTAPAALRSLRGLRSLLVNWRPMLVHAHGSRGALYAGLAARALHISVIWHVRIADRDPLLDGILLALSARVIAISKAVRARFDGSRHAGKVRVVYNGVEPGDWIPTERPVSTRTGPVVLLVGRLSPSKGQATLVRAAPAVLEQVPTTRFVLLGADSNGEADRLRQLSSQLAVSHSVEIRAWMEDPRPAFQEADVVTLPSRSEGFGRVLVEAACLAKPVVASRVGGIPEVVVDGETGLLIPPDDPPALAGALLTLLRDPDLRHKLGAAARERALACFTARQHVEGVEAVYAELLETRQGSRGGRP
jgi:glycosyltransferase involved in cell wall biosynthesis